MARTTVITSATSGIGKAVALKVLKESTDENDLVIANYGHNQSKADAMLEEIPEESRKKIKFIQADMSEYDGMTYFVDEILKLTDSVDWLVLNTGIGTYEKFEDYTFELWTKVMNTNVSIPAFLVKLLKPHFNDGGKIVFMGSNAGEQAFSTSIIYGVSKAAVHFLTKSLLKVFDGTNICINAIAPGFTQTPWHVNRSDESYERINKKIALHRFGNPDEIAKLCYDVMTNNYINGSILDINGGYDYF